MMNTFVYWNSISFAMNYLSKIKSMKQQRRSNKSLKYRCRYDIYIAKHDKVKQTYKNNLIDSLQKGSYEISCSDFRTEC